MRKLTLTACFLFALFFSNHAQVSPAPAIEWQKSMGGETIGGESASIDQTTDGGYIVTASILVVHSNGSQNYDFLVIKLNSKGVIQWQKMLGDDKVSESVAAIKQTTDGGYIVAGYSKNNYWLAKLDASGIVMWQKFFGGTADDGASDIQQTTDGGYIIGGYALSNDGDVTGNHGKRDFWVVKTDVSGNIEWQKSLGGSEDEVAYEIRQATDGGYIIAGYSSSNDGDVTGNHAGFGDGWVVKLNSSGTLQWQKCLGGSGIEVINGMESTSDGGCIVAAPTDSNDGDVTGNHGYLDYWIVKLNSAGSVQWQKCLGGSGAENVSSIDQTSDGGYIVAGGAQINDGDVTGNHGGGGDFWIVKLNSSGALQWQKSLGGTGGEYASAIEQTTDNGYIIAGISTSNDGDVTGKVAGMDTWVVKLEPDALLPVTLIDFSGEVRGKQNVLHWATVTEQNNTGFEVQRSSDAIDFSNIGFIETKSMNGNSNVKLDYNFIDMDHYAISNYYRLKQIDKDGKYTYSHIVVLNDNNAGNGLFSAYPNPAKNILNVKTSSTGNNMITMLITDLSGKLVLKKVTNTGNGESIIPLNVSKLSAGTYFLKMFTADGKENAVKKFVKL